jgi:hypothetical protein
LLQVLGAGLPRRRRVDDRERRADVALATGGLLHSQGNSDGTAASSAPTRLPAGE